jgi:ureidoacrylate peracid hydrolase
MSMHKTEIFPEIMKRIAERRGDSHLYEVIEPAKTAMVVIDMQNCWVMESQPGYSPYCPAIVPNINRIAASLRETGGTVVWIQMNHSLAVTENWQRFRDFFPEPGVLDAWSTALTPGALGYQLWAGLEVRPGDITLEKHRFSCFTPGSSDLHERLKARSIDTLLIAGTSTNICCESTARDAHQLNYRTIMLSDATATRSDVEHNATLSNLFGLFADVMTADEVVARLGRR